MAANIRWDLTGFLNLTDTGWTRGSSPPDSLYVVTPNGTDVIAYRVQALTDPVGTVIGWEYVGDSARVIAFNK